MLLLQETSSSARKVNTANHPSSCVLTQRLMAQTAPTLDVIVDVGRWLWKPKQNKAEKDCFESLPRKCGKK